MHVRILKNQRNTTSLCSLVTAKEAGDPLVVILFKTAMSLGHRKLRESQDVLSNSIWLPLWNNSN